MTMSDKGFKIKPVVCDHCLVVLALRRGDTLIARGFEVEMKKSHNILCGDCRRHTRFCIDKKRRDVVKVS